MKIGIINIEPKIVNTAYMQIAAAHRAAGDTVEWALPLEYPQFDRLYCSSLFTFTDTRQIHRNTTCGGTGFNLKKRLPDWIERAGYDYSIYPECDYSIVRFSRGCVRRCGFCVVPEKEGMIKAVAVKNLNPSGKYIVVQDNNFFASPGWDYAIDILNLWAQPVDFAGVDIRLMTTEKFEALATVKRAASQSIKIAWDDPKEDILPKLTEMLKYIPAGKIECYVLIGYQSTPAEDLHRVRTLWDKFGVRPFVMPFDKKDRYQKAFANWVNRHYYKIVAWKDFKYNPDRTGNQ